MTLNLSDQARPWHTLTVDGSLEQLQSDRHTGLTAQQIEDRLQQFGPNELQVSEGRTAWAILIDQFKNIMLIMLIAIAIISGILSFIDLQRGGMPTGDIPFKDTIAILAIVLLNGILGYVQESRAEKALAALKNLTAPKVQVVRDGMISEISSKQLVPGDVMLLEAGVQVAADGRLLEAANLQVRESALTGESHAVNKQVQLQLPPDTALGDRLNLVFQGTEVVHGRGKVVVTGTAMSTELGKIATLLQSVEAEPTPLQRRMDELSKVLVSGALILVAIVVGLGLLVAGWGEFRDLLEVSLSMAVAVVPEGLAAVTTVTLALGTQRMVRRQALIRKLPAVETLGSVTTICSDKTGTLTQNKMVVQSVHPQAGSVRVTGEGYSPEGQFFEGDRLCDPQAHLELQALMMACVLCNDAVLQKENGHWAILGDATEGALLVVAAKSGIDRHRLTEQWPRVGEFPFSSERKRMSTICQAPPDRMGLAIANSPYIMFTKGSAELVLERCTHIHINDHVEPLTASHCDRVLSLNNTLAGQGLRVLGFAYKPYTTVATQNAPNANTEDTEANAEDAAERDLIWLGLVDMLDAPRPEVREAVKRCRSAGIRPVMITGDHQLTAMAIAQDLGIATAGDRVLTGRDLEKMSPADLEQQVDRVSVYARVAPEHKLRIVQALKRNGGIIAMTGDGVNDAPALKQADIGIAMGITGTDVSKEASDMVLLDDNFATIVSAVEEGRVVYTNIRRFIKYILGSNIGEVLTIAASPLLLASAGGVPMTPLQILWMNLVTDGLPALALAVEPAEPNVMKRSPHDPQESIFARGLGLYIVRIGIVLGIIAITLMVWSYNYAHSTPGDPDRWKTMVFTTLCVAQMGHAMAIRSNTQLTIELNPISNPYVLASVVMTTILQLMLIYVPPLRSFFGTHWLNLTEISICFGFSALMFVWIELEKLFMRWYFKHR
ncbi:MAG TPA: cation-translocating P-type ATPase [Chroococcidiopsis sp.]